MIKALALQTFSRENRQKLGLFSLKSSSWALQLLLMKKVALLIPLSWAVFFVLISHGVGLALSQKSFSFKLSSSFKLLNPLDFLFSFSLIALFYCLLSSLQQLPTTAIFSLLFSFPLFLPLILKFWMGKKIASKLKLFLGLFTLVPLFYFRSLNHLEYLAIFLALIASALKALEWITRKRFYPLQKQRLLIKEPYFLSLFLMLPLLLVERPSFHLSSLLYLLVYALAKWTELNYLKHKLLKNSTLESYGLIYSLGLFFCLMADFLYFKNPPSYIYLSASCINSLFIFVLFSQKKILPNPLNPL